MTGLISNGKSIAAAVAVLFLLGCTNDPGEVKKLSGEDEDLPMEITEDLVLQYSDSATVMMELAAARAEFYPQIEEPQRRFPQGIKVKFFDGAGQIESQMWADRAIQYIDQDLWKATGNVVVVNRKAEQLNTEQLFWDQKKEIIYSEEFVKISTDKEIIMGEGFEAEQNFNSYVINKVTGQIDIEDEEDA